MNKLIVLPSWSDSLGGMTVSISMMIAGFSQLQSLDHLCVLVRTGSLLENYLQHLELGACLYSIPANDGLLFYQKALNWVAQQPKNYPLLLENCTNRFLLPVLGRNILSLKLSGRRVYHVFRDLASSHHLAGKLMRQVVFTCLAPGAICNSQFTASSVTKHLWLKIQGILYPPVDLNRFSNYQAKTTVPQKLQPILDSGAKIILTPSRITEPGHINDKNLRGLILVLAKLRQMGHRYHGVIIGQDYSPKQIQTNNLLKLAEKLSVSDRLTILPPTFEIENYYHHADVLVTLAPREPFGRTVVEAIACGVPVVGSNTGGIGEILSNFAPQWTVDPENSTAVAQTIMSVAEDPKTSLILTRGQKWVKSHCSPKDYAQKLVEIVGINFPKAMQKQPKSTLIAQK